MTEGNPFVRGVISLTLGVLMVTQVLIPTVKGANTDNWTSQEVALWGTVTVASIIGIVYGAFSIFGLA